MKGLKLTGHVVPLCLAMLVFTFPAVAEEVVVKNDSVVDFGQAVIVGNFLMGEQAGARLTSPCDGTIVAVQIIWLEGTPGHPQSLEEAIHIYTGAGFPIPGAELALLEGPVMTPGYINEFRYLDEAQTIPLEVPVIAGENFYVTLEFYNPTDVGNGGPSVVRDTDECQSNRNVLYGDLGMGWNWYDFCMLISGDLAIRAIIDCQEATGACCYANGNCANEIEESDCQGEFGATWHEGLTCAEITCTPRGACCRMGGCLQLISPSDCAAIDGVYAGDGTNCNDDVCVAGACCLITGQCLENFGFECEALYGNFLGPGSTCDPNPCPQPEGACCIGTLCLADQTEAQCTGSGGEWVGPFTDCGPPNPCETPPVCAGDSNCDEAISWRDIDYFVAAMNDNVAAWEAMFAPGEPSCSFDNNDVNGDGTVNWRDIDPFVAVMNTTCP
ncbi:MAG: hypothetical protein KAY37_15290 [Phycisphaerae bacterium]|nr:hypothetical protein [Phycisphaerae bacterium]